MFLYMYIHFMCILKLRTFYSLTSCKFLEKEKIDHKSRNIHSTMIEMIELES